MSYRVLARTYRSHTFDEVVGQESIATTLKNAITSNRVHHGYLFTGTRGVGKTSMARILAKALNCLSFEEATTTPCCECDSCKAIAVGEDVDVVEIDAASNTGVDNIRELRSNAIMRPARARYKIYIIDEVHMLSSGAFNALLKTLEEPPSHVKFILATTESHKVPATIQSRCQRFDFRAIGAEAIAKHLESILKQESVEAEEAVIRRIARLANGSMRDALSLLDKLLSYGADQLTSKVVDELIPPPHDELAAAVVDRIAQQDAAGALSELDNALQTGRTVERFCDHLIEHLRTLMILNICGEQTDLTDVSENLRGQLFQQAQQFDAPTYVYMISLLEELRRSTRFSGAARALADATIVRLSMSQQFTDIGKLLGQIDQDTTATSTAAPSATSKKKPVASSSHSVTTEPSKTPRVAPATATIPKRASQDPLPQSAESKTQRQSITSTTAPNTPTTSTTPSKLTPTPTRSIPAEQMKKITDDPLVMRVKEAVEGTLLDVRPLGEVSKTGVDQENQP